MAHLQLRWDQLSRAKYSLPRPPPLHWKQGRSDGRAARCVQTLAECLMIRTLLPPILPPALFGATRPASAGDKPNVLAQVRQLEKEIEAVRGLKFKEPVKAKVIPRPAGAALGIQGYYSTKDKTL